MAQSLRRVNAPLHLTQQDFDDRIAATGTPVIVDFYAPWCAPCHLLLPLLDQLANDCAGRVTFFKVNIVEEIALMERFDISEVPTLLFFVDGEPRDAVFGFASPRDMVARVEAFAAEAADSR